MAIALKNVAKKNILIYRKKFICIFLHVNFIHYLIRNFLENEIYEGKLGKTMRIWFFEGQIELQQY